MRIYCLIKNAYQIYEILTFKIHVIGIPGEHFRKKTHFIHSSYYNMINFKSYTSLGILESKTMKANNSNLSKNFYNSGAMKVNLPMTQMLECRTQFKKMCKNK